MNWKKILKYLSFLYFILLVALLLALVLDLKLCNAQSLSGPTIKTIKQYNNSRHSLNVKRPATPHITGTGTSTDPYLLHDAADFDSIRYLGISSNKYYKLANDIDLKDFSPWSPFGTSITDGLRFEAKLDGDNHKISNLTLNPLLEYPSLLGIVNGISVSKLIIENVTLNFNGTNPKQYIGVLLARNFSTACTLKFISINNVNINYRPTNTISTFQFGCFGQNSTNVSIIQDCHITNFNADIRVGTSSGNSVGGFVSIGAFSIARCSIVGVLNTERTNADYQFGSLFAGNNLSPGSSLTDCFARGEIKTSETNASALIDLGGFLLYRTNTSINRCYSSVLVDDGVITSNQSAFLVYYSGTGSVSNSYYNRTLFSRDGVGGGSGAISKTTTELQTQSTYTGWDYTNTWSIDPTKNNGYPYLTP